MLEPEQNASGSEQNPNSEEDQRISSSASRDRCIITIDESNRNSAAKSLSDTASIELALIRENFSRAATASLSMGKVVPESAADPRGISSVRFNVSVKRIQSR